MDEKTAVRKLLVLRGPAFEVEGILGLLDDHFDVEIAADLDQALAAMIQRHIRRGAGRDG
jgi:hypothetical protein